MGLIMDKNRLYTILPALFLLCFSACDHGLQPDGGMPAEITGISGKIIYQNWASAEPLFDLRLVVFKNYPPDNILTEVLSGNAVVYPALGQEGLPSQVDTSNYTLALDPGVYEYVVVAWQYGPNVTSDWRAAGQFQHSDQDTIPETVVITEGHLLRQVDIHVDFNDLPTQPF
jgi:hypothetical protein